MLPSEASAEMEQIRKHRWRRPEKQKDKGHAPQHAPVLDNSWTRCAAQAAVGWATLTEISPDLLANLPHCACHVKRFFPPRCGSRVVQECLSQDTESWSKHHVSTQRGPEVQRVLRLLTELFSLERVVESRVNVYLAGENHFKPQHQDRNAHDKAAGNISVGASFGAPRVLEFQGLGRLDVSFSFCQQDGDIFAFDSLVNSNFTHGVPPSCTAGDRVSVVLWGVRNASLRLSDLQPRLDEFADVCHFDEL